MLTLFDRREQLEEEDAIIIGSGSQEVFDDILGIGPQYCRCSCCMSENVARAAEFIDFRSLSGPRLYMRIA